MKPNPIIQDCLQTCANWGLIPTEFRQCMTWEEQVLWLAKFLKETVIPTVNANTEAFNGLKVYVENFFDNLDVQEEINNKLDEMAESGVLADIIAQYLTLAGVLAYNTINDLENAENLTNGSIAMILGVDSYKDGKRNFYKVREITNTDVVDGFNIVALNNFNNLVAERTPYYYDEYNLEFHDIENAHAGCIIKFPNGKIMIVDPGKAIEWTDVKNAIDSLGITKVDYLLITHFHDDHLGNIHNICTTYDVSDCTCWVQVKPDFANHSAEIAETEEYFDTCIAGLIADGLTPIVPTNNSYVDIDTHIKLHFLNTDLQLAETYDYYSQAGEWQDTGKCNFNMFSVICEVIYGDSVITITGDIETASENANTNNMHKSTVLEMPHHGINRHAYKPFYLATNPDYAILHYNTAKGTKSWLYAYYEGYKYVQELGSNLISKAWSTSVNGLYTFLLSKDGCISINTGMTAFEDKLLHKGERFGQVPYFINYLNTVAATTSLADIIANMKMGDSLSLYWYSQFNTDFPQLLSDLQTLCPDFAVDSKIDISKIGQSTNAKVVINVGTREFVYIMKDLSTIVSKTGYGVIKNITNGTDALITELMKYPVGHYICPYFQDTTNIDSNAYSVSIDVVLNDGTKVQACCTATNRSTSASRTVINKYCYIDSALTPKYSWL